MNSEKQILLIDLDDTRRHTRVRMLETAGYNVAVCADDLEADGLKEEASFDLVILALHRKRLDEAAAYSERLRKRYPSLPLLLLLDTGVFIPRGTLSQSLETGIPLALMQRVAEMLAGSTHIRELKICPPRAFRIKAVQPDLW